MRLKRIRPTAITRRVEDWLNRLDVIQQGLLRFTEECRNDMHEPDEQDMTATVRGEVFDNAGVGDEIIVTLKKGEDIFEINLATLIAMARMAEIKEPSIMEELEKI